MQTTAAAVPHPTAPFLNICRGQVFDGFVAPVLWSNTANTGNQQVTVNHRIYLRAWGVGNPHDAFAPGTVTVTTRTGAIHNPHNTLRIQNVGARIPCGTPPGTYLLMHFVDSGLQVAEYSEFDNTSIYPFFVLVQNCNTLGC